MRADRASRRTAPARTRSRFNACILRPRDAGRGTPWAFLRIPGSASAKLPRRGRTSVEGTLDGHPFIARLEPDGERSHWLPLDRRLCAAAAVRHGQSVEVVIAAVDREPEPKLPPDLRAALDAAPEAKTVWERTTTLARVDWIHWLDAAKQAATRRLRVVRACAMLAAGERRVCCFDPSGVFGGGLGPPAAEE
jgi:hypothetical protein